MPWFEHNLEITPKVIETRFVISNICTKHKDIDKGLKYHLDVVISILSPLRFHEASMLLGKKSKVSLY